MHPNRKSGCISAKLMIPYSPPVVFIAVCTSSDRGYGVGITEKTHEIHHCVQQVRRMEPVVPFDHVKGHTREELLRRMWPEMLA